MKKQRKLIGVIAGEIELPHEADIMRGICETAFAQNFDIAVFSMFIKEYAQTVYQTGECNIYNLINYDLLDGIILLPNTIRIPSVLDHINHEIQTKFNGPVICLDYYIEEYINLEFDDVTSIEKMIDHLIDDHHLTNLAFLTGPKEHPHAMRRLKGYINALKKHNLPVNDNQIFFGDFWYTDGELIVNRMLNELPQLPQALICACDASAVGICDALRIRHIRIPEDIAVTGFDAQPGGIMCKPTLTTMEHNTREFGHYAVTRLIEALDNLPNSTPLDTTSRLLPRESCGCPLDYDFECSKINQLNSNFIDTFYNTYNYMMEELISADNLNSLLERIMSYTELIENYEQFSLSLCDNWDYVGCSYEASQNYNSNSYTPKMHLKIHDDRNSKGIENSFFPSSIMHPDLWKEREKPSVYFFNPLHFQDRCFGYTTISYSSANCIPKNYRDWIRTVGIAFENLRVKNNYKWSNQQLEEYAQIDSLTKIFNRNGYMKYSDSIYETALHEQKELLIIMGDLNNLKSINDNFGHIEGDNAIQICAVAFQRVCNQSEKCFRYGGDEFILLGVGNYSKTDALLLEKGIQSYLKAYNEVSEKPYEISISIGYWHGTVDRQHGLDDYLKLADQAMFDIKQRNKIRRSRML